jgi:hypothetical protein
VWIYITFINVHSQDLGNRHRNKFTHLGNVWIYCLNVHCQDFDWLMVHTYLKTSQHWHSDIQILFSKDMSKLHHRSLLLFSNAGIFVFILFILFIFLSPSMCGYRKETNTMTNLWLCEMRPPWRSSLICWRYVTATILFCVVYYSVWPWMFSNCFHTILLVSVWNH